jgi:hypothetical protein
MFTPELQTSLSGVRDMKNQLKILTAALLMTAALCSSQALAAVSETAHSNTTIAAAAQNIQVADWDFEQTGSDEGC